MSEIFNIVLLKPNQPSIIYKFGDVKKGKSLKKNKYNFRFTGMIQYNE